MQDLVAAIGLGLVALLFAARAKPHTEWIAIAGTRDGVHDAVLAAARDARARDLVPVLYLRADYAIASARLQEMRETAPMQDALRGIAVISVDAADDSPYSSIRTSIWHSFHALDRDGEPTGIALDPGTKDGPCASGDAAQCAVWLRPFMRARTRDRI